MARFSFDTTVSKSIQKRLSRVANSLERAAATAQNRTATSTVAFFSRSVRQDVNVKAARLKKATRIHRARPSKPVAIIDITGAHITLADMGARQTRKGVSVRQLKAGGREVLKSAFIATMRSGHVGVFRRTGKAKLPIKELYGPSPINLWKHREIAISRHALSTLAKEMTRQIQYYRSKS